MKEGIDLKLLLNNLSDKNFWNERSYNLPKFDIEKVKTKTKESPTWLHFGAGNIFRIFPAMMQQQLLNNGEADTGIIVCESFDEELIQKVYTPYDNLTIAVSLKCDGSMDKEIVASITESMLISESRAELERIFSCESLQMVSFTITEKGYADRNPNGLMALITQMCYKRYQKSQLPLALVSMDNCSNNGDKLKDAVISFAQEWEKENKVEAGFTAYLQDPNKIFFPLSMIDKITPRPSDEIKAILEDDDIADIEIIKTNKNTFASCFVNAEETGYLVIEDKFPNGRPKLENAGVLFVNRETVHRVEQMKVCTCLNPLHTVLAVFGCLLSYESISAEMKNKSLKDFIQKMAYTEGLPVVVNPEIIDPKHFADEVIEKRLPNPFVPDTPQRIACDTSQKIPVRFGETLKAYLAKGDDITNLTYIPLFFAGWLRYLMAIDDSGKPFELSPDPMLDTLLPHMEGIALGQTDGVKENLKAILSNADIFGVNLYEHGLAEKVESYFEELIQDKGSVAATLKKYIG